ncbi:ATP-binding protein [Paenibacillus turpanensis]|uniref:ATP-binding protein n=1 Tax=Paenibacillus turpanensis TaxID=2689078 RepID=UPI00140D7917|nr:ATP-binding protein [Paenibacillus turpanensis]
MAPAKEILFQTVFVLMPILLYQIFYVDRQTDADSRTGKWFLFGSLLVSMFVVMTTPVQFNPNFLYDLRLVPIVLCFFYCGYRWGIVLTGALLIYRYYLGGIGFYGAVINYTLYAMYIYYPLKAFQRERRLYIPVLSGFPLAVGSLFIPKLIAGSLFVFPIYSFALLYVVLCVLVTFIGVHVLERGIQNVRLRFEINHSQARLKRSLEQYRMITDNSHDLIAKRDINGYYTYVSPASNRLLGYAPEEMLGSLTMEYIHPEDRTAVNESYSKQLYSGKDASLYSCRLRRKDGEYIWFECIVRILRDEAGRPVEVLSVSRDTTERKQAEEMMLHSEKLAIAGQLAAGIAHEIRNPLTSVKGFLQLLKEGNKGNFYPVMESELDRIELIVSELLVLSKPQADAYRKRELTSLISNVVAFMESQANLNNVQIHQEFDGECWLVCDENRLKQVFINLIKNAIEAMPDGGPITIRVTHTAETAEISVMDKGRGIPAELLRYIGKPFYTTKYEGTGLGLMVAYKIIQNHRGSIGVRSEKQRGTVFTIRLPLNAETK